MKWPKTFTIAEARTFQEQLRKKVRIVPLGKEPRYVAGVDAAFSDTKVFAAVCLYRCSDLSLVEQAHALRKLSFPYVPGFLSFREGPAIIAAVEKLKTRPDILLVDGQGIAHPRRIGIASHLGVMLGVPSIGCAKTRLIGEYNEPGRRKSEWSRLCFEGEIVGAVLRTRDSVNPVFVSPGHKIDLESSIRIVLDCTGRYRLPEPIRCADMLSKIMKKRQ